MKVYYVNSAVHKPNDVLDAFIKALELVQVDKSIKTITLLITQQSHIGLLSPIESLAPVKINQGFTTSDGYHILFRTLKTYHPQYLSGNSHPSEILIPVCIRPEDLYQFEDYSNIACWIIIPWLLSEYKSFLSIHEAIDCKTGNRCPSPDALDERVANALDWLRETSNPDEGYFHSLDEDRLKNIAVKLRKMHIGVDYNEIVYYCLHHGYCPSSARKTAEYFVRAQTHSMKLRDTYDNLEQFINTPR